MMKTQPSKPNSGDVFSALPMEEVRTFCSLPHHKLILNSYGEVSMCCHQLTQLGKLDHKTSLMDLWNCPLAKEIRETTKNGQLHSVCKSYNSCPYLTKEKSIFPVQAHKGEAYPMYLEICLPDKHCNVGGENPTDENPACIMCKRNFTKPHQQDLTDMLCEKAKEVMPYLQTFCVLGIAEAFWKDAVFKIFEKVNFEEHKSHIQFYTNTNGICLNERTIERFFHATTYSCLAWSLDAATAITHRKIRRLDTFDLVVQNLKYYLELRKNYGGSFNHKVSIYNNINLLNVHEMVGMVELAAEWGVDWVTMLPTYDQSNMTPLGEILLNTRNLPIFRDEAEKAMKRARKLKVDLRYQNRFDVLPPTLSELVEIKPFFKVSDTK